MSERTSWRAALAALAAASGVGLASGRELVLFFAQMKDCAWAGVAAASALYGLLVGGAAAFAARVSRESPLARACEALRLLLAALVSAFMLYRLGRVGALTLPLRHGYVFGAGFGLLAALALNLPSDRGQARLGLVVAVYAGGFFLANALDPRPVTLHRAEAVEFALQKNLWAALALAAPYAAINACAAHWRLGRMGVRMSISPASLGVKSALLCAALLSPAVWALLRAGDEAMAQPMPGVVLSARWGLAGFWLCAGLCALCAAATLSAALGLMLNRLNRGGLDRARAAGALALALVLLGILSCQ